MTDLIAELSTSHGGERAWQEKLIESCAIAGFDFAKFQSFEVKHLKASDPQFFWLAKSELSNADHLRLVKSCSKAGVSFLTTVFSVDRVAFLHDLGLHAIKVGSGESGVLSLLEAVAQFDWKIYVSTGLWTRSDLDEAMDILAGKDVTLLHTVSEYPTLHEKANLSRIHWLRKATDLPVGYSDHTIGKEAAFAVLGLGVDALEVHHSLPGAPRRNQWDKDLLDLKRIGEFARSVQTMWTPQPMLKASGEKREFIGRWQQ